MDLTAIAHRLGITPDSARTYHARSQQHRAKHTPKPGDMPPPDYTVAGRPAWEKETIEAWITARPGKGFGGGRPRRR